MRGILVTLIRHLLSFFAKLCLLGYYTLDLFLFDSESRLCRCRWAWRENSARVDLILGLQCHHVATITACMAHADKLTRASCLFAVLMTLEMRICRVVCLKLPLFTVSRCNKLRTRPSSHSFCLLNRGHIPFIHCLRLWCIGRCFLVFYNSTWTIKHLIVSSLLFFKRWLG